MHGTAKILLAPTKLCKELNNLFNSLIVSLFSFGAEVWGCAAHSEYVIEIDQLLNRALRFGYVQKRNKFWILSRIETLEQVRILSPKR